MRIIRTDGEVFGVAVHGGFLSVTSNDVVILVEDAQLSDGIDVTRVREIYELTKSHGGDSAEAQAERQSCVAHKRNYWPSVTRFEPAANDRPSASQRQTMVTGSTHDPRPKRQRLRRRTPPRPPFALIPCSRG